MTSKFIIAMVASLLGYAIGLGISHAETQSMRAEVEQTRQMYLESLEQIDVRGLGIRVEVEGPIQDG